MKHAREDYNRIQDPENKIPAEEPVFLFRAQDQLACQAVAYYAELCMRLQSPAVSQRSKAHAAAMEAWPVKKVPDLPADLPDLDPNDNPQTRIPKRFVLMITTAYEQGVGKGHQAYRSGKEIINPYGDTLCIEAWQYGYEEGKEQAGRMASNNKGQL